MSEKEKARGKTLPVCASLSGISTSQRDFCAVFWDFLQFRDSQLCVTEALAATAMTADSLFETTSIPGHLAPTPERLERLLSKQTLEELYEVEEQPFAR